MTHIKITKGLDIPILGNPEGKVQDFSVKAEGAWLKTPKQIGLNLTPFDNVRFKLLKKVGDTVKIGEPVLEDKQTPGRVIVSPAGGKIADIRRGLKRKLEDIVIDVAETEEWQTQEPLNPASSSRDTLKKRFLEGGLFAHIRQRPFDTLADPEKEPRTIFIKALESAPFVPPAELQVEGHEKDFQTGLVALKKLTNGPVKLIYRKESTFAPFKDATGVEKHTAEGPHPISNPSVHIQQLDPIRSAEDVIWTLTALDVVAIGHYLNTGKTFIERIVSIAGPGVLDGKQGYFRLRQGFPVSLLTAGRIKEDTPRFISGDPLMGEKVEPNDFLGFYHTTFTVIPEETNREFLHFFRLGMDKYSMSRAYMTGHEKNPGPFPFTTSLHGEPRPFVDATLYEKVMPLNVPTMLLVKSVMAEDYDRAEELGLLEVVPEDFALTTFVCPSKVEMTEIVRQGLQAYAAEVTQ